MKFLSGAILFSIIIAGLFLLLPGRVVTIETPLGAENNTLKTAGAFETSTAILENETSGVSSSALQIVYQVPKISGDVPNQLQLANPPAVVKGIYLTGWSAGSTSRLNSIIALIKRTELNTVVIDIKDYSGYLSYAVSSTVARDSGALGQIRILHPNAVIKRLHDEGIYVIGRITAFQDPIVAEAYPEWALKNKATGEVWKDRSGLAWLDPASEPVWEYLASIARDALARGFDEINFDYIRFASDGDLANIGFPSWDMKTARHKIIGNFFSYIRNSLGDAKLSADLFGLTTVNHDDLGIGQVIEDAYKNFDYVSPMVYPSHFATGFLGYKNPAAYPYEVVDYSMSHALYRLLTFTTTTTTMNGTSTVKKVVTLMRTPDNQFRAKLRPWLQDFDLGATYDAPMVDKQIQAMADAVPTSSDKFGGWLLWNPANIYTEGALQSTRE